MSFDLSKLPSHLVSNTGKKEDNGPVAVKVGDGATVSYGSDRSAYTVIEVRKNGRQVVLQRDNAELISGDIYSSPQDYIFSRNTNGATMTVNWAPSKKRFTQGGSGFITIGSRDQYYDPHF